MIKNLLLIIEFNKLYNQIVYNKKKNKKKKKKKNKTCIDNIFKNNSSFKDIYN